MKSTTSHKDRKSTGIALAALLPVGMVLGAACIVWTIATALQGVQP
jgi:hypothetical protein